MRLQKGDKMPNFTYNTADKTGLETDALNDGTKTIYWVLRYIGCTSCRYDVSMLANDYHKIAEKGAKVVMVMQSTPEMLRESLGEEKLPYDIISDPDMKIYKALQIEAAKDKEELRGADQEKYLAKRAKIEAGGFKHGAYEGEELQLPALFIVDGDGTVEYAHYAKSLMDMPTVDELAAML